MSETQLDYLSVEWHSYSYGGYKPGEVHQYIDVMGLGSISKNAFKYAFD